MVGDCTYYSFCCNSRHSSFYAGINYRKKVAESQIGSAEKEAERIVEAAKESAEAKKKESILEGKDEIHRFA